MVRDVYAALSLTIDDAYDEWLQAQAEREKKHHSKFEYSLGEFEVSTDRIESELDLFYQQFGWPRQG